MKGRIRKTGFTLIELLTALFVLSVALLAFGSMVYSVMNSASRSKERAIELRFASNERPSKAIFQVAEAGLQEARSRLQTGANGSPLHDSMPSNPSWMAFIGEAAKAIEKGYQSHNPNHSRYERLNSTLEYVVTVTHKLDGSGKVLKWGDRNNDGRPEENTTVGESVYVITSQGYSRSGASQSLRIEAAKLPPIQAAAALYTKEEATLQGSSTYVQGLDPCGAHPVPGVLSMEGVRLNGVPTITGSPSAIVEFSPLNIDLQYLLNQFKRRANHQYNVNSVTLPGMDWGSPVPGATQRAPSDCSLRNIVYFNTNDTYVRLSGGSQGCGTLLVEGDLSVHGGFQWYGIILVTGSITFTGGGEKKVSGAVMAGGMVSAGLMGGDANIVFCRRAVRDQTSYLPLVTLRWVELFS
jgi:prepilin-type N-terminal cleavage/methylation domain-containing protein